MNISDKFVNIMKLDMLKTNEESGTDGVIRKFVRNHRTSIYPTLNN